MAELSEFFRNKQDKYVGMLTKNYGNNMAGDVCGFDAKTARHLINQDAFIPPSSEQRSSWAKDAWEEKKPAASQK